MQVHPVNNQWISIAITVVIVAIVLAIRLRSVGRARPLRLETLWIIPAIYSIAIVVVFWSQPPHGLTWLYCALAVAIGAALGWQRGKLMKIDVDPRTHAINQTTSPAAIIFVVVLVIFRSGSRAVTASMGMGHSGVMAATDILMAFALGFLMLQRVEMFLRARRLLAHARAMHGG